jgi:hypothetical protein
MHVVIIYDKVRGCDNHGTTLWKEHYHIFMCDPIVHGPWSDRHFTSLHAEHCPRCSPGAEEFKGMKISNWADQTKKREWLAANT